MEIMEYPALHKDSIKGISIFFHIHFQNISHHIIKGNPRSRGKFKRIFFVVLGDVKHRNLRSQNSERHCFFTAGTADISNPDSLIIPEINRVFFQFPHRVRQNFFRALTRLTHLPHPEIIGVIFPCFLVLNTVILHKVLFLITH